MAIYGGAFSAFCFFHVLPAESACLFCYQPFYAVSEDEEHLRVLREGDSSRRYSYEGAAGYSHNSCFRYSRDAAVEAERKNEGTEEVPVAAEMQEVLRNEGTEAVSVKGQISGSAAEHAG